MLETAAEQLRSGDLTGALQTCQALLTNSGDPELLHLLGLTECALGHHNQAVSHLRQAVADSPDNNLWTYNLAVALTAAGSWEAATQTFIHARDLGFDPSSCTTGLRRVLLDSGQFQQALDACAAVPDEDRSSAHFWRDLGRAHAGLNQISEALKAWRKALTLDPAFAAVHDHLEELHRKLQNHRQSLEHAEHAARLRPECGVTQSRLAAAYWFSGRLEESLAAYNHAIELDESSLRIRSGHLFSLLHMDTVPPERIRAEHEAWARIEKPETIPLPPRGDNTRRRLRIGYVYGELYFSASNFFLASLLLNHDLSSFDVTFYHTGSRCDEYTATVRRALTTYRDASRLSADELARQIVSDEIDILVDLSGHYPDNGLSTFRRKPALVQANYPNYPATTGVSEIEYLFTDRWTDPPGMTESHYTEQLIRLPSGHIVYRPSDSVPEVSPSPALAGGYVTFGLFQRPAKLNGRVWDVIAECLVRTPNSRLLIHCPSRDLEDPISPVRLRMTGELSRRGVRAERMDWAGPVGFRQHMEIVGSVDINFDTFPYNGQTTTCEALWMGVPTVALKGNTHVSRVGYCILDRAGMGDWVASSPADYIRIATTAASDPVRLADTRQHLRSSLLQTPLLDGRRFAAEMEEAYQTLWHQAL